MKRLISIYSLFCLVLFTGRAEDGSRLWLRNTPVTNLPFQSISYRGDGGIAVQELQQAWAGMTGSPLPRVDTPQANTLVLKTEKNKPLGKDGFSIRTNETGQTILTAQNETAHIYGIFHLLRLIQTGHTGPFNLTEIPTYSIRILNHWDNLNDTIERGYAGYSLWKWDELPATLSPRYEAYARANASIGINATVLNNVNANPQILSTQYLEKVKAIADIFRPYGIQVYLSVNFASPAVLDGLADADPLRKEVCLWWKNKVKEIYTLIPDFGGFLVKANSEGQPGPQDYGRTHADGANMLAEALKPYKGIVMWRAFVYDPKEPDRAKQAYDEFMPLDGKFHDNVIVQVKNGPVDFQPREPFTPLFGAMKKTPVMAELQITQEYLGFSNHLAYLGTMWEEFLQADTWQAGEGSTVVRVTDGTIYPHKLTAISGVANIGEDTNWTGHHFAQANWYAFGRLAWNHNLTAGAIAGEWLRQTFTTNPEFVTPVTELMLQSREAVVNYMMPLGLHHLFAWGHHYGPEPWCDIPGARPDWLPGYYHKTGSYGIGFDRTHTGSNAVVQYHAPLSEQFNGINTCPEPYLLWFHHAPWDHRMKNGRILWDELCYKYDTGVQQVRQFQKTWDRMQPYVDTERFLHTQSRLRTQARDAVWWKDACLLYFQQYSKRPVPYDIERPVHELEELKKIKLDMTHHN